MNSESTRESVAERVEFDRLEAAAAFVRRLHPNIPRIGIVLGSGFAGFASTLDRTRTVSCAEIPHFPSVTIAGHSGELILGNVSDTPVAVLSGRSHFYESGNLAQAVFPVRLLARLGIVKVVLTNAAGAINLQFSPGEFCLIRDHINCIGNPLLGPNDDRLGPRFPDMSEVYSARLRHAAQTAAARARVKLHAGVYLAVTGPSYETPAEIAAFRRLGADLVGMSTAPEAIAARHAGIEVLGLSLITNMAAGVLDRALDHKEVLAAGRAAEAAVATLLGAVVAALQELP